MKNNEKVVLTGEGADELLFGYDRIFRWALECQSFDLSTFFDKYGYSTNDKSSRLENYILNLSHGKSVIHFLEDFFYQVHLPGLLRRMDFASMAASKEARVPFVNKNIIEYLYRLSPEIKINNTHSKIPLRNLCKKLNLNGALNRKKIGFSAQINKKVDRKSDYDYFQNIILNELGWL